MKHKTIFDVAFGLVFGLALGLVLGAIEVENQMDDELTVIERKYEACHENYKFLKYKYDQAEMLYLQDTGKDLEIDEGPYIRNYYKK